MKKFSFALVCAFAFSTAYQLKALFASINVVEIKLANNEDVESDFPEDVNTEPKQKVVSVCMNDEKTVNALNDAFKEGWKIEFHIQSGVYVLYHLTKGDAKPIAKPVNRTNDSNPVSHRCQG